MTLINSALLAGVASVCCWACAPGPDQAAGASAANMPPPVPAVLQGTPYADVDLERGELLSFACQACHTIGQGEPDHLGPNLYGLFGRQAAFSATFDYSAALRASAIVWSPELIDRWLAAPNEFIPGNNMVFAGYGDADDRRHLVGYLIATTTPTPGR